MERYRTTLILVGILAVLGVAALLLNNRGSSPTDGTPTPTALSVWQEPNQVTGIDVVSGTQRVSLRKDVTTTVWSILEPISDTADVFAVGGVADQLQTLVHTRELTGVTDLAQYGLADSPMRVTVTFSDTTPTRHSLLVGTSTPDGSAYYAKRDDNASVYLLSVNVIEPLRSWLIAPPRQQPTPTPIPVTVVPTSTITPTSGITGTVTLTGTQTLTGTLPITSTNPGAANSTTPLPATVEPVGTPVP